MSEEHTQIGDNRTQNENTRCYMGGRGGGKEYFALRDFGNQIDEGGYQESTIEACEAFRRARNYAPDYEVAPKRVCTCPKAYGRTGPHGGPCQPLDSGADYTLSDFWGGLLATVIGFFTLYGIVEFFVRLHHYFG